MYIRIALLASAAVPVVFMSAESVETVSIDTENGPVLINKSDYKEGEHKLTKKPGEVEQPAPASGTVVIPPVEAIVPPAPSAPDQMHAVPPATVAADAWLVMKLGNKWFVTDAQGNKITDSPIVNKAGYPTEEEARAAIVNRPFAQPAYVPGISPAPPT